MTPGRTLLRLLIFGALYVAGDWLGDRLVHGPDDVVLVWLPAGVAFAVLVLYGPRYWPFIPAAELLVQFGEAPASFIGVTMAANTLAALAATQFLRRMADVDTDQFVVRSGYLFVAAAAVLAVVSALIGVGGLMGAGYFPAAQFESAFSKWLVANFFGTLLISPSILSLAQLRRRHQSQAAGESVTRAEQGLWVAAMMVALAALVQSDRNTSDYAMGLSSLPLALLMWSALRFPVWVTAVGSLCSGLTLALLAGLGLAGFTRPETMQDAVILLTFLSIITLAPLFLTGAANQNRLAARHALRQARTDALTGLPNRSGFEAMFGARTRAHASDRFALLYLDLDNFKLINDTAGHAAGDELVRSLVGLLQAGLGNDALLARLGGDEFAVLLPDTAARPAIDAAQRLREGVAGFRFAHTGHVYAVTSSIGMVTFAADQGDYSRLLAQADAACFTAKELGGNRVQNASADTSAVSDRTSAMRWAVRLREGIEHDHFRIYCQSIAPLHGGVGRGRHFEVLIRLQDPETGGLLMPGQFVPAAERFRMGPQLDRHVLDRSLRWLEQRPDWLEQIDLCSINLCAASVEDEGFVAYLHQRLAASPVPPHKICFEITETSAVRDLGEAQRFIDGVRGLGCRLALDDFGTGFCSFAYLDSLDVDYFKIDGSFVRKIEHSELSLSIVRAIADIARSIGKRTVAEFVETPGILERLLELGVDFAQGYAMDEPTPIEQYFSKPAPALPERSGR